MSPNRRIHIILFVSFLVSMTLAAGANEDRKVEYPVSPRVESYEMLDQYLQDEDFAYGQNIVSAEETGFFYRLRRWIGKILKGASGLLNAIPVLLRIILWGLVIVLIYILITRTKIYQVFYTEDKEKGIAYESEEATEKITDFQTAIEGEEARGNLRSAVRLFYLWVIQVLDRQALISFSAEKTNIDYQKELEGPWLKEAFTRLTGIYNSVWYGQYDIDHGQFTSFKKLYESFIREVDGKTR